MIANRWTRKYATRSKSRQATAAEIAQVRDALRERFATLIETLAGAPA